MERLQRLKREYNANGIKGVLKRGIFFIPNKCIIKKNARRNLQYGLNSDKRNERVIVSLTSFPPRFKNIHLCLKSLLFQTYKPDRIVVWLGNDVQSEMLTPEMRELEQYGIEYRFDMKKNLKPHKKYFYVMQEEPESIVITVDDDSIYPINTIESLMNTHKKYPRCVCARRVHRIKTNKFGYFAPYRKWTKECRTAIKPSHKLLAVGVGGVLYPPRSLDEEVFKEDVFMELCPGTDDIWLKYMELRKNTKVVWTPCFFAQPPTLEGIASLNESNVLAGKNDECIRKMENRYKVTKKI